MSLKNCFKPKEVSPEPVCLQNDMKMQEIIRYTHLFLQKFCMGNQENQALLHKNLNLFLNPGVPGFFCSYLNAGSNSKRRPLQAAVFLIACRGNLSTPQISGI